MTKVIFLSLFVLSFNSNANTIKRFLDDVADFSFTASEASITLTNKINGNVEKIKGEGCSAYAEQRNGKLFIIATSNLKYVRLEVAELNYNQWSDEYIMEHTNGNESDKMRFLIGSGSHLLMTATYEGPKEKEEIWCNFNHKSKIKQN